MNILRRATTRQLIIAIVVIMALAAGSAVALAGGDGPKPPHRSLAAALHEAATAKPVPGVTARVIGELHRRGHPDPALASAITGLTERETDVLRLIAGGLSNAEIAAHHRLSEHTVKTHVGNLFAKLGLRDRAHAVMVAYESGLVVPGA